MSCLRALLCVLLALPLTVRAQSVGTSIAAQHTTVAACYAAELDELSYTGREVMLDCPDFFGADGSYESSDLSVRRLGPGETFAIRTASHSPCGGVNEGMAWLNAAGLDVASLGNHGFWAQGHDARRDVVYGLHTRERGGDAGPFPAVRYAPGASAFESLGRSCFSVIVVPESDAWVCERGDGEVEVGSLDLAAPLPAPSVTPIAERMLSLDDLVQAGYALGRGLVLIRRFGEPGSFRVEHRIVHLPVTTTRPLIDRFTPDLSHAGAIVDLAHMASGPFIWFRDALARYASRHGMQRADATWPSDGLLAIGPDGARTYGASASMSIASARARLGLSSVGSGAASIGIAWASPEGSFVGPLEGWARRLGARDVPVPLAFELGVRFDDARFFIAMVVRVDGRTRVERFLALFEREDADAYVEPLDASRTRVTFVFDDDALPRWLASELPFPMDADIARRLGARSRETATARARWQRRTDKACTRPLSAGLSGDFAALVAVSDEGDACESIEDAGSVHQLSRVIARAAAACMREDDDACVVWRSLDFDATNDVPMLVATCERMGGALCRMLLTELQDTTRVAARVEADCARGRARDCRALLTAAQYDDSPADVIARHLEVACAAGDADACASVAERERRACADATHCDEAARRMIDACTSGSYSACMALYENRAWIRLVGVAPARTTQLRIHRRAPMPL